MNWINAKAVTAIIGAAVVAGTGTYFVKETEANRLRDENQKLLTQQAALVADNEAALKQAQTTADELEKAKRDASDVMRLRGQVAALERERDAERHQMARQLAQPKPSAEAPKQSPNSFTKGQMSHVGYDTPEAALQTIAWATMSGHGTSNQIAESLSPELLNDKQSLQVFEENRKQSEAVFKSVDMLAKKTLSEDKVEFKIALNVDLGPNAPQMPPSVMILPMTRIGSQWKLAGHPKENKEGWDDGQVLTFGQ